MKKLLTTLLISSSLIYAANAVAAEDVQCPTLDMIHKNASMIDRVHHNGQSFPKRFEYGLKEGDIYSSKQFKSGKKNWDLGANIRNPEEMFPDQLTDQEILVAAQTLAKNVTGLFTEAHVIEKKYEAHACVYNIEGGDYYQMIFVSSTKGKLPIEVKTMINKMVTK